MALDSTLFGHLRDLYLHSEQWSCPLSSSFLTQDEWRELVHYFPSNRFFLTGGYPSAERKMAIFLPEPLEEGEDFDLQSFMLCLHIEASGKKFGEKLEHREVLGALLGKGIERDALGDVLVEGAEAYSFCLPSLQEEIASLQEVGPHKVQVEFVPLSSMNFSPHIEIRHGTISSNRLDGIVSEMFSCSRAQAQEAIDAGKIFLGASALHQKDMEVEEGAILTFRGKGKAVFCKEKGSSRKGKILIEYGLYR